MTAGASGSFGVNGTDFTLQPTEHGWVERPNLDTTIDGHIVYPAVRSYSLRWNLMSPSEYNQVYTFYLAVSSTGTVVVDLPEYAASEYRFYSYTGCTLSEPSFRNYFSEHIADVKLEISDIVV